MEVLNIKLHFSDNIKTLWINFHFIKDYTQRITARKVINFPQHYVRKYLWLILHGFSRELRNIISYENLIKNLIKQNNFKIWNGAKRPHCIFDFMNKIEVRSHTTFYQFSHVNNIRVQTFEILVFLLVLLHTYLFLFLFRCVKFIR